MEQKTCGKCKTAKDRESFSKQTAARDGLNSWCRDCVREYGLEYRRKKKQPEPLDRRPRGLDKPAPVVAKEEARRALWAGARDMYSGCGRA